MSWEQLGQILAAGRQAAQEEASRPPVVCPNPDATPLDDVEGIKHCPFDGWTDQPLPLAQGLGA